MYASVFVYSGSKIFSTFIGFLKSKDPNDGTEQALLDELSIFNDYLKENVWLFSAAFVFLHFVCDFFPINLKIYTKYFFSQGPFINGKDISAADLSLGPKLYHLEIVLGHYKKWAVPDSLNFLKSYLKVRSR